MQHAAAQLVEVEVQRPLPLTVVVRPGGELDTGATAALDVVLQHEIDGSTPCRIVLDLSRVHSMSSAALQLLLRLHRQCRVRGVHLVLVGTGLPAVNQPLRISGLLPLFDARATVEVALRGLACTR